MSRCRRTYVADANTIDAPARTERGDVDAAGLEVVVDIETTRRRRWSNRRADRGVLQKNQALDCLESETLEAGAGLHTEGTATNRVVAGES